MLPAELRRVVERPQPFQPEDDVVQAKAAVLRRQL